VTSYKPTIPDLRKLIGRADVYAVQYVTSEGAGAYRPVWEPLTPKVLRDHRAGEYTVGTYTTTEDHMARTLVFDIDSKSQDEQDRMLSDLLHVLVELRYKVGRLTWAVEDSGNKGYHVWVVSSRYMNADVLYRLGRGIREEAGYPDMEVFPKQREVKKLGNLVKLPGGFHAVTGKPNDFITFGHSEGIRVLNYPEHLMQLADLYPETQLRRPNNGPEFINHPCVDRIQRGVTEGKRNIHLFHLATMLRRFSLTDENVRAIIERANALSVPPLDDAELDGIIENSTSSGPICGQVDSDIHCGEQCLLERGLGTGLKMRKGAVAWGQPGERIVVEIAEHPRDGLLVELVHPDLEQARVVLHKEGRTDGSRADVGHPAGE